MKKLSPQKFGAKTLKFILSITLFSVLLSGHANAVEVQDSWARASLAKNSKNSAVYLILENTTDKKEILLNAFSDVAEVVEIHTITRHDRVMRMQKLDKLEIPAGGVVKLEPGGHHIMLMGLKKPLTAGDNFDLTLDFKNIGKKIISVDVLSDHSDDSDHHGHGHGHHHD